MPATKPRYALIDWLRVFAMFLMVIYHATYDLTLYQLVPRSAFEHPAMTFLGRSCLLLFLFCVGYSLALSHEQEINWKRFWQRWLKIAAAAVAVSIGSYLYSPKFWIYFGILHHVAIASIIGLAFLRFRYFVVLMVISAIIIGLFTALPHQEIRQLMGHLHLRLTGNSPPLLTVLPAMVALTVCSYINIRLTALIFGIILLTAFAGWRISLPWPIATRGSLDHIPIFPWIGAVLIGIGASYFSIHKKLTVKHIPWVEKLSQQSLWFYLIHQPVLVIMALAASKIL